MGYLYALFAAVLFGAGGSITKATLSAGFSPAQVTLAQVLGTSLLLGVVLLVSDRSAFKVTLRQLTALASLGIAGIALLQFTFAVAILTLPVGIALLFEYLALVLVALTALIVFRESVKKRLWIAIGFVLFGLACVAQVWNVRLDGFGMMMAFCSAMCLTIYFVLGERVVDRISPLAVAFWTMTFASAFWLVFGAWWEIDVTTLVRTVNLGGNLTAVFVPIWALLMAVILLGSFMPYLLEFMALKRLTATATSIATSAEVVVAFIVAWLWLAESMNLIQSVGAVIVLSGIILSQTARAHKPIVLEGS